MSKANILPETIAEAIMQKKLWHIWYEVRFALNRYDNGDFDEKEVVSAIQNAWEVAEKFEDEFLQ